MRYKIVEGSESGHCCFYYTVVDTSATAHEHTKKFKSVAECFDDEDAKAVCKALNLMHSGIAASSYHKYE